MQVATRINHSIEDLPSLSAKSTEGSSNEKIQFAKVLDEGKIGNLHAQGLKVETKIPDWVDPHYPYDPNNPRKPNMRELIQAASKNNHDAISARNVNNWQELSVKASETLYGVVGSNKDTRDWTSIMEADDIFVAAQAETGKMYRPTVDIESYFGDQGKLLSQAAVLKDQNGNILRFLPNNIEAADQTLRSFGATHRSIPIALADKIMVADFDETLLNFLQTFDRKTATVESEVIQNTIDAIANKLPQEIPTDELAKL